VINRDWTMPRRTEGCAACQRPFEVGQRFQAFLYDGPEGYERRDYCLDCRPADDPPPIGSWMTHRPEPSDTRRPTFDPNAMYTVFEQLEDATDDAKTRLRFALALLLWRKRTIKLEHTETGESGEVWTFVTAKTEIRHRVLRPDLEESQLEQLSNELETLLAGGTADPDSVVSEPPGDAG
jgi:hypothetical protein